MKTKRKTNEHRKERSTRELNQPKHRHLWLNSKEEKLLQTSNIHTHKLRILFQTETPITWEQVSVSSTWFNILVYEREVTMLHKDTIWTVLFSFCLVWYLWLSLSQNLIEPPYDNRVVCLDVSLCTVCSFAVQHNPPPGPIKGIFFPHTHKQSVDSYLVPVEGTAIAWRPPPQIWGSPDPAGTTAEVWGSRLWTLELLMTHTT